MRESASVLLDGKRITRAKERPLALVHINTTELSRSGQSLVLIATIRRTPTLNYSHSHAL